MNRMKTLGLNSDSWIKLSGGEAPSVFEALLNVTCIYFEVSEMRFPKLPV